MSHRPSGRDEQEFTEELVNSLQFQKFNASYSPGQKKKKNELCDILRSRITVCEKSIIIGLTAKEQWTEKTEH